MWQVLFYVLGVWVLIITNHGSLFLWRNISWCHVGVLYYVYQVYVLLVLVREELPFFSESTVHDMTCTALCCAFRESDSQESKRAGMVAQMCKNTHHFFHLSHQSKRFLWGSSQQIWRTGCNFREQVVALQSRTKIRTKTELTRWLRRDIKLMWSEANFVK